VSGSGPVTVGFFSPGDCDDHGFYEWGQTVLQNFARSHGWKTDIICNSPSNQAPQEVEDLCRQPGMDLVVIETNDDPNAYQALGSSACQKIPVWTAGSVATGTPTSKYYYLARDDEQANLFVVGYAAGLYMQAHGYTKIGFITGPAGDGTYASGHALLAGVLAVVPKAQILSAYTGDYNASGPAVTAANAMIAKNVQVILPYLGGASGAVAKVANASRVAFIAPGFDGCSSNSPQWAISGLFSPGFYMTKGLTLFAEGRMRTGVLEPRYPGRDGDYAPSAIICHPTGAEASELSSVIHKVGDGQINVVKAYNATKYSP
jgi:basic membrane protein A